MIHPDVDADLESLFRDVAAGSSDGVVVLGFSEDFFNTDYEVFHAIDTMGNCYVSEPQKKGGEFIDATFSTTPSISMDAGIRGIFSLTKESITS